MGWAGLAATIQHVEVSDGSKQTLRRDIMGTPLVQQLAEKLASAMGVKQESAAPELLSHKTGAR
jgi:hypothetical protein